VDKGAELGKGKRKSREREITGRFIERRRSHEEYRGTLKGKTRSPRRLSGKPSIQKLQKERRVLPNPELARGKNVAQGKGPPTSEGIVRGETQHDF